jgi:hypothetical protein
MKSCGRAEAVLTELKASFETAAALAPDRRFEKNKSPERAKKKRIRRRFLSPPALLDRSAIRRHYSIDRGEFHRSVMLPHVVEGPATGGERPLASNFPSSCS